MRLTNVCHSCTGHVRSRPRAGWWARALQHDHLHNICGNCIKGRCDDIVCCDAQEAVADPNGFWGSPSVRQMDAALGGDLLNHRNGAYTLGRFNPFNLGTHECWLGVWRCDLLL